MFSFGAMCIVAVAIQVSLSLPVPPKVLTIKENQNHEIDNVEVHHDVNAEKGQELVDDQLPEKDDKLDAQNDAAGDGNQPNVEVAEEGKQPSVEVAEEGKQPNVQVAEGGKEQVLPGPNIHQKESHLPEKDSHLPEKDSHLPEKESDLPEKSLNEPRLRDAVLKFPDPNLHSEDNEVDKLELSEDIVKNLKRLSIEQLVPADHLDIVKMEQDGHVNSEYHKEMFLGDLHDEFKAEAIDQASVKLQEIVASADLDNDGFLSVMEMEEWILKKMKEHFDAARKENDMIFEHLDPDGDGFIKWKEYYLHFLLSRGFDAKNSLKHVSDYDDSVRLDQEDKDALISYKFKWTDADTNITDNRLNRDEFMVFRHPEHSKRSLETMVSNVMRAVDTNDDKLITEDEFAALPPGEVESKEFQEMDRKWQEERKAEFHNIMDVNGDGKVGLTELKNYLDPMNPVQAKVEAASLMTLMDDNKDSLLSMDEILRHSDIFISSKLVNFAANVHDEF